MKLKLLIPVISMLLLAYNGYSQEDSLRTKNDKPGTPQSLRKSDNTPQTHIQVNKTISPNQASINRPSESNNVNNTNQQTITVDPNNTSGKPSPVNPTTITETPPDRMRTTNNSSAIQNGISNASKPIRNQ